MTTQSTLAAPYADVTVNCEADDSGVTVTYRGPPDQLIASGAIEPDMAEVAKRKSKARVDSQGFYFHREVRIDSKTMTRWLVISRCITDPAIAERLPGVTQGLKFDRLDYLDGHRERVHVSYVEDTYGCEPFTRRYTAGSASALVAAGFPARYFGYFSIRRRQNFTTEPYTYVTKLMRGYFEVGQWHWHFNQKTCPQPTVAKQETKPLLRLVWSNDGAVA